MELPLCPEEPKSKKARNRVFSACDACYRRKIKCEMMAGRRCDWCSHHNVDCTFTRPGSRTWKSRNPQSRSANPDSNGTETVVSPMPVPISRVLGQLYLELPNRRTLLQYVDEYEVSAFRPIFPVIEPDIFRQTVNTTYQLSSRDRVSCSAKLSMLCFFHFFNTLRLGPTETDQYKHDLFEKSQTFLESILAEPASIDGIQALVMMLFLAPLYGDEELFISYHSAAWAMILNMGGHANLSVTVSTNTHLRNLFWLCYTIDKGAFPGHYRQFSLIDDTLCDLSLPTGYVDRLLRNLEILPTSKRPFEGAIFPADIRLSIIKSKIFTAFLSPTAIQKPTREVLRDIRFLDKELEDWRSSISSTWNLTLFVPTTNPKVEKASFHMFMLRLDYYWCITNIHHACYQLTTLSSVCYNLQQCINSSFAICLEASRSALLHLQVASKEYTTGRFGFAISFCLQNFNMIYCNILRNPQGPDVMRDLELIRSLSLVMESFTTFQEGDEIFILHQVGNHVKSLSRAAQVAVDKAYIDLRVNTLGPAEG